MDCVLLKITTITILVLANACHSTKSLDMRFLQEPDIPEGCFDEGYCENVPNYPKEYASDLIAKLEKKGIKFGNHRNLHGLFDNSTLGIENAQVTLCYTEVLTITPKAAKGLDGRWHFILNREKNPIQQFKEVKCKNAPNTSSPDMECNRFLSVSCHQKNITIALETLNPLGNLSPEIFSVPCCCSCE